MRNTNPTNRYARFVNWGNAGKPEDVDRLMEALAKNDDLATTKLVDYALGLVDTRDGRVRLRHYLFNGSQQQRNYAALYFKRRGQVDLLDEAVVLGMIDEKQAYSR
jgi:hypothetical protein